MIHNIPSNRPTVRLTWVDAFAILALIILAIAFFWKMIFTDLILPRGDVFTYFYPYWQYRNATLLAGRLPLWNPYLFMGVPFLANSQSGVLYPPNWLLIWLGAPSAVKAAIVLHTIWGAIGMYLFGRRTLSLGVQSALASGAAFALGGYLSAQVEHVNQLQGLAWLPWLFWLWDEVIQGGHLKAVLWLGLAMALQLLAGHSQSAFISGVGLGAWALWHSVAGRSSPPLEEGAKEHLLKGRIRLWPLGALAAGVVLALGLAAAQLAPTLELTRVSNRSGGLPFVEAVSFSLRPWIAGRALLPSYSPETLFSEYVGYVGVAILVLGLIGAWVRRKDKAILGLAMLAALGLFLAVGAYNPVYWALVKIVPGFNLFRAPARWMVLWAFGMAGLAGVGLDLVAEKAQSLRFRSVLWLSSPIVVLAALAFLAPLSADNVPGATRPGAIDLVMWGATLAATLGMIWWMQRSSQAARQYGASALAALAIIELFLASRGLPYNDLSTPEAWFSQRPAISTLLAAQEGQTPPARFLSLSDILFDPGDLREIEAIYGPYLSQDALYDFIVATKQKEILAPNLPLAWSIPAMDGFDGGVLPTRDYTRFTSLFLDEKAVSPDGRLRENLTAVPDLYWLRLANVGWIITDKVYDVWFDHIYYDLQFPAQRTGSASKPFPPPIEAYPERPFEATAVGVIGHLEGAEGLPDGTQVGTLALYPEGAASGYEAITLPLVVDERQPGGIGTITGDVPAEVGSFTPDHPEVVEYHTLVSWGVARRIEHVEITVVSSFPGTVVIRGLTLIDERSAAFVSTTISEGHSLRVANSGDVKIYEYRGARPRAYVVCGAEVAKSTEEMWAKLREAQASNGTVIEDQQVGEAGCDPHKPGEATITSYEAERVAVKVRAQGQGVYLVLSDAWYPGWEATVDGQAAEILHANGLFRAVRIPQGEHEVVFAYRSRALEVGAVVSGITLVGVIIGLVVRWPSRGRDDADRVLP